MQVILFFDGLSNAELLTFKTGSPCIRKFIFDSENWMQFETTGNMFSTKDQPKTSP